MLAFFRNWFCPILILIITPLGFAQGPKSAPVVPGFGRLFNFYFSHVLPRIGGAVSGSRGAYEYLPDSVSKFPNQKNLAAMMAEAGFESVTYRNFTGGIAALHCGTKA